MATCSIIDALLEEHYGNIQQIQNDDEKRDAYQRIFLFAAMWGIGGAVGGGENGIRAQKDFSSNFKSHQGKTRFPDEEGTTVFDYYYNSEINDWQKWDDLIIPYEHPEDEDFMFSKILVHSIQTCRLQKLCAYHVSRRKPVLFIGNSGTGKTVVIKDFLNRTDPEQTTFANINFNSYTTAPDVQINLELKLINKTKEIKGCLGAKILVYFVDDLNMQAPDTYNTQTTIELLRQIHDSGEVFDRDHCEEKRKIADVLLFGCQNPKAGSFKIDLRLQRHFTVFAFMVPDDDILFSVYGKIMNGHLKKFDGREFEDLGDRLVKGLISFYNQIMLDAVHFSPSGDRFTYQFNLREYSKVIEGTLQSRALLYKGAEGA